MKSYSTLREAIDDQICPFCKDKLVHIDISISSPFEIIENNFIFINKSHNKICLSLDQKSKFLNKGGPGYFSFWCDKDKFRSDIKIKYSFPDIISIICSNEDTYFNTGDYIISRSNNYYSNYYIFTYRKSLENIQYMSAEILSTPHLKSLVIVYDINIKLETIEQIKNYAKLLLTFH